MGSQGWWNRVFVEGGDVYADVLEARVSDAPSEAAFVAAQLEEQGVEPGSLVLDLGCGIGRHCIELAKCGYRVTGLDLSPRFVEIARTRAEEQEVDGETNFVEGDMREASDIFAVDQFDAVVSLFSSFGFFDEAANRAVLEECAEISTDDAVFVIDLLNRDSLMRDFQPTGLLVDGDLMTIERRDFDFVRGRARSKWTILRPAGDNTLERALSAEIDLRIYCLHELIELFDEADWDHVGTFGDLGGSAFELGSPRLVGLFERE